MKQRKEIGILLVVAGAALFFVSLWLLEDTVNFQFLVFQARVHLGNSPKVGITGGVLSLTAGIACLITPLTSRDKTKMFAVILVLLVFSIVTLALAVIEHNDISKRELEAQKIMEKTVSPSADAGIGSFLLDVFGKATDLLFRVGEKFLLGTCLIGHGRKRSVKENIRERAGNDIRRNVDSYTMESREISRRRRQTSANLALNHSVFNKFKTQLTAIAATGSITAFLQIAALIMAVIAKKKRKKTHKSWTPQNFLKRLPNTPHQPVVVEDSKS